MTLAEAIAVKLTIEGIGYPSRAELRILAEARRTVEAEARRVMATMQAGVPVTVDPSLPEGAATASRSGWSMPIASLAMRPKKCVARQPGPERGRMTARKLRPEEMPDWPRLLDQTMAAAYLRMSVGTFKERVARAVPSIEIGGLERWDRRSLDRWVDLRSAPPQASLRQALAEGLDAGEPEGSGPRHGRDKIARAQ